MIIWDSVDTVLLDMDGTLLDLDYDNTLWNDLVPARYAAVHDLEPEEARRRLFAHMRATHGRLEFYCLDYWAEYTGLDIIGLHRELTSQIRYRPSAERFLGWLKDCGKRSLLVTNAHRDSLGVKNAHSNLVDRLDAVVSAHDYGAPKESPGFWSRLRSEHPYRPARTLLIDDNASVLAAAGAAGIRHLLTILQPDSARPPRDGLAYPALNDFREILPDG